MQASKILIIVQLYDSPWWSFRKAGAVLFGIF